MAAFGAGDQVAGQGNTATLPNFVGELFRLSPTETPLLSMIGGLTGGLSLNSTQFTWQDTLHRAPADHVIAEGVDATFVAQKRSERKQVVQIFQYGVEISYSKSAATGLIGTSLAGAPAGVAGVTSGAWIGGSQPVMDEMSWQLGVKLEQAALDVEWAFLNNTFANPTTTAARQTQGLIGAITTVAKDGDTAADWGVTAPAPATGKIMVNTMAAALYTNGAPFRNPVIMVGAAEKLLISSSFQEGNGNIAPRSYNVFGVNVTDIETDVGRFGVVLNRHMPAGTVLFLELDVLAPAFMPIPGKGHFFLEPLAKSGSYERMQLYGEIGLQYGPEGWHGKVVDFDNGATV